MLKKIVVPGLKLFILATALLLSYSLPISATIRIAITEVLKDPVGLESECPGGKSHEFIEIANLGSDTFRIECLFLSDGSTVDSVIPWQPPLSWHSNCCFNRDYILPGQFALILDRDYEGSPPGSYFTIADSTVILTVDASSLASGLTTTKGLFLFKGTEDTISDSLAAMLDSGYCASLEGRVYHTQPENISEGFSNVPANLLFTSYTYIASPDTLSMGAYEFMQDGWVCEYKLYNPGSASPAVTCSIAVLMAGKERPENAAWSVKIADSTAVIASGTLPDSLYPVLINVNLPKDSVSYELSVEENDKKAIVAIDISSVWLPSSPIKINEIFPRATSSVPEWVELVNVSSMPVNLKNWRYGTPEGTDNTIASSDLIIKPGNFLVLTKSSSQFSVVYPVGVTYIQPVSWQSLDNYRDSLVLISSLEDAPCEIVYYDYNWFDSWNYQSVERVSLQKSGTDKRAWVLAEKPSPGQPNPGAIWQSVDKPSMHIGPIPFTPNNDRIDDSLSIRITLPASQKISIAIYGFNGRKLYDMPEPIGKRSTWNGRKSDGTHAPAGPFFVIATITNSSRETLIRKKGILWR